MKNFIIVSVDLILEDGIIDFDFYNLYLEFNKKFVFLFVTRDQWKQNLIKHILGETTYVFDRVQIRDVVTRLQSTDSYLISLGFKDVDYVLAQNNKFIFLRGDWKNPNFGEKFEKAKTYGILVSCEVLKLVLTMVLNHEKFYYHLNINETTEIFSILDPRNYYADSFEEKKMISAFENILKRDSEDYRSILRLLFLIMITKEKKFKEVNYCSPYPSSSGKASNNMYIIEKDIRRILGIRGKGVVGGLGDILIRYRSVPKSHHLGDSARIPCDRHFDSIYINSEYQKKLKGKTICIIDDYTTHGTASEVARNLLKNTEVKNIYFLTLGKFSKYGRVDYNYQEYNFIGNIFSPDYRYELVYKQSKYGTYTDNSSAIKALYTLINKE